MESVFYSGHRKCFIGVRLVEGARGRRNDRSGNCSTESSQISHLDSCCKIICLLQSKHGERHDDLLHNQFLRKSLCYCVHVLIYILTLWLSEMAQNMIFFSPPRFNIHQIIFFLSHIPVQFEYASRYGHKELGTLEMFNYWLLFIF